jgi:hypothetical protein
MQVKITKATMRTWFGQATTGGGIAALAATGSAAWAGQTTWAQAFPLLVAGFVGMIWPENTPKHHPRPHAVAEHPHRHPHDIDRPGHKAA